MFNMLNWQPYFWKLWLYMQLFAYVDVDFLGDEKVQLVSSLGLLDHFLYIHFFKQVGVDWQANFSVRVQCGCLVNEVDFKDYNQRGDITDHMCQRRWVNLPGSWCQKIFFCFLAVLIYHRAIQIRVTAPQGWLKHSNVYDR